MTFGAYGLREDQFFGMLQEQRIDLFVDLRARRGMRGHEYAYANRARLEARLREIGIDYLHAPELAPTPEIRDEQAAVDAESGVARRKRAVLSDRFMQMYRDIVLTPMDWPAFASRLGSHERIGLFCVEGTPEACHRSLAAEAISRHIGGEVSHWVRPGS